MNIWQVQATTRRKNRARTDILGLLEKGQRRKRTSKKPQAVIRKQFGIFAKSQTFNVQLINENGNEPTGNEPSQTAHNKNTTQKSSKRKKSGATATNRMQEFDVVDLIDDNITVIETHHQRHQMASKTKGAANDQRKTAPPQGASYPIDDPNNNQSENVFLELGDDNQMDFGRISVDFTIGTLDATAKRIDTIEQNLPISAQNQQVVSTDFNALDNHIGANIHATSTDFRNFQSDFVQSAQPNGGTSFHTGTLDDLQQYDWLLNTPYFSDEQNSNLTTTTSFQVDESEQNSIETILASIDENTKWNGLTGFSPSVAMNKQRQFSSSQCHQYHSKNPVQNGFCFDAGQSRDIFSFQSGVSNETSSSIESTGENTAAFNDFDAPNHVKPFTLNMVIERKRLGAHRAHERIFCSEPNQGETTSNLMPHLNRILQQQTNGGNQTKVPAKTSVPLKSLYKNSFENPIWIL